MSGVEDIRRQAAVAISMLDGTEAMTKGLTQMPRGMSTRQAFEQRDITQAQMQANLRGARTAWLSIRWTWNNSHKIGGSGAIARVDLQVSAVASRLDALIPEVSTLPTSQESFLGWVRSMRSVIASMVEALNRIDLYPMPPTTERFNAYAEWHHVGWTDVGGVLVAEDPP